MVSVGITVVLSVSIGVFSTSKIPLADPCAKVEKLKKKNKEIKKKIFLTIIDRKN
jgi:hypothetical protein